MADLGPMDRAPERGIRRKVGDYINLTVWLEHSMHLLEARVVCEHADIESVGLTLEGELVTDKPALHMRSELRVSQRVEVEDVPGTYRLRRVEIVTASMRTLTKEINTGVAPVEEFEIIPEPDEWAPVVTLDEYEGPLHPSDWEQPEEPTDEVSRD